VTIVLVLGVICALSRAVAKFNILIKGHSKPGFIFHFMLARLHMCTAPQSLLCIYLIQRHSVSVRSTCLLDTVYKLKLHREVGSGLTM